MSSTSCNLNLSNRNLNIPTKENVKSKLSFSGLFGCFQWGKRKRQVKNNEECKTQNQNIDDYWTDKLDTCANKYNMREEEPFMPNSTEEFDSNRNIIATNSEFNVTSVYINEPFSDCNLTNEIENDKCSFSSINNIADTLQTKSCNTFNIRFTLPTPQDICIAEQRQMSRYHATNIPELTRILVFIRLWRNRSNTIDNSELQRIQQTLTPQQLGSIMKDFCTN